MPDSKPKLSPDPNVTDKPKSERLDSIDALRAVAALAVGLFHVWGRDGTYPWPSIGVVTQSPSPHWLSYLDFPMRWGYLGVSLFLVLSGFCIHLVHAKRKARSGMYEFRPREFFLRRVWRLYPAYAVAVILTAAFLWILQFVPGATMRGHEPPNLLDLFTHLTLTHGYIESTFYSIASVFWSLALEFQLYLAYPIFLWLFMKLGTGRAVIALTIVSLIWRFYALNYFGAGLISIAANGPFVIMGCAIARMPEWLLGAWLAERYVAARSANFENRSFSRARLIAMSVALFCVAIASTLHEAAWVFTDLLFGLAFCALVAAAIFRPAPAEERDQSPVYKWLVQLGVISYSIYLFHLQFLWIISPFSERLPGIVLPLLSRIAMLAISIIVIRRMFVVIEQPFLSAPNRDSRLYQFYRWLRKLAGIKTDAGRLKKQASDFAV